MDLTDFLIQLAVDPASQAALWDEPEQVIRDAGLNDEDARILLSGDPDLIFEACKPGPPGGWAGWLPRRPKPRCEIPVRSHPTNGSLVVVGTGIALGHLTLEARAHISHADRVFYVVPDPVTEAWIRRNSARAESLASSYKVGRRCSETYVEMADRILEPVREGERVCAAFYGHPGVFVNPSHAAIRQARAEGFSARMLPGISAEDCLFADLGVDPARGCQAFEATDFLLRRPCIDPLSSLVLWQVGALGETDYHPFGQKELPALPQLVELLVNAYGTAHQVTAYGAAQFPVCDPRIETFPLSELATRRITVMITLYVPPVD